jgi:hypothetical protein
MFIPLAEQLDNVRRWNREPNSWALDWYRDRWQHSPKPVRLLDCLTHRPGVRRVTVDLGAHWTFGRYIRPIRVRGKDSAHAEVLAAAAHFPRWLRSMDGQSVPYTWSGPLTGTCPR